MSFKEDGFFSPTMPTVIAKARAESRTWFALVDRLRKLSQNLLLQVDPPPDPHSVCLHVMFARAVTTYQASVLLAERGLPADSRTLARSFLETTMFYGAATGDPEFHKRLVAADRTHKVNIAKPLINMGTENSGLDDGQVEALQKWLDDAGAPKPGKLRIEQMMEGMAFGDIYDTYFRGLSGDSAHTTILSLDRHTVSNDAGEMVGTKWGPDLTDTDNTLMTLCSVMFYLLLWVDSTLALGVGSAEIGSCWEEYKRLAGEVAAT
jgi:hypothetical protein